MSAEDLFSQFFGGNVFGGMGGGGGPQGPKKVNFYSPFSATKSAVEQSLTNFVYRAEISSTSTKSPSRISTRARSRNSLSKRTSCAPSVMDVEARRVLSRSAVLVTEWVPRP